MKKSIAMLLVAMMALGVLAGCTATAPAQTASTEAPAEATAEATAAPAAEDLSETGTLKLAWVAGIGTNSIFECPYTDIKCLYPNMLFSTLVKAQPNSTFTGDLATEYAVSDDGLVYTFKLNPAATFSDGTAVTASDVVFSINTAIAYEKSWVKQFMKNIVGVADVTSGAATELAGVKAIDANTVEITEGIADNALLYGLALTSILPAHAFEGVAYNDVPTNETFWSKPYGSGQYVIDQVSFPNYFTMVRSESYFGTPAGIKNVLFTSYDAGGNDAIVSAAIAGDLDFIFGDAVNDSNTMKNIVAQNASMVSAVVPSSYTRQFRFNLTGSTDDQYNTFVQDVRVRTAFELLMDKATCAAFYGDQANAAITMINPNDSLFDTSLKLTPFDVAAAKALLDEAGYDYSKTVRVLYYYSDQTTADIMEVLRQGFEQAGVKFEPFLASGDLANIIYTQRNWDMIYSGGGSVAVPAYGYALLAPDGGNWDSLFGNVEERAATYGASYNQFLSAKDEATAKAAVVALQQQQVKDKYDIDLYNLSKMIAYNGAHVQFDTSILAGDYQQSKDYKFEDWKLIG